MRIKLHQNGWTPIVENWDIKTATSKEIKDIATLLYSNTIVVFLNQELSVEDEIDFCHKFGDSFYFTHPDLHKNCVSPEHLNIQRVTGNLENPGVFPNPEELEWHLNKASNIDKKNIVWLYGVEGTVGSRTSWINTILAYQDLHPMVKKDISTARIRMLTPGDNFLEQVNGNKHLKDIEFDDLLGSGDGTIISDYTMPLVHTNVLGVNGLYWPSRFVYSIEEDPASGKPQWTESRSKEMIELLHNHVFQEKYMYHHDWDNGDAIISEQFLGIHKRWAFPAIHRRLLHRMEFDTSKVNF